MFGQLIIFLVVWFSIMGLFMCVGNIIFFEMVEFTEPASGMITLI